MALGKTSAFTKLDPQDPLNGPLSAPPNRAPTEAGPKADAGQTAEKLVGYAKKAHSALTSGQSQTFNRGTSESAYQQQRSGERETPASGTPSASVWDSMPGDVLTKHMDAMPTDMARSPYKFGADMPGGGFEDVPSMGGGGGGAPGLGGELNSGGGFGDLLGGAGVGDLLGGAGGLLSLINGARSGNPTGIAGGLSSLYGTASSVAPDTFPSITAGLSELLGGGGGSTGATSAAVAAGMAPEEAAAIGTGLGSFGAGAGAEAGTAAAAGAGGAGFLALGPLLMAGLASGLIDTGGDRRPSIIHEAQTSVKDAPIVSQRLSNGAAGFGNISGADATGLQNIIDASLDAQGSYTGFSDDVIRGGTKSQGIQIPDFSSVRTQAERDLPLSDMAMLRAEDKLYNQGGNIRSDAARTGMLPEGTPSQVGQPFDFGAPSLKSMLGATQRYSGISKDIFGQGWGEENQIAHPAEATDTSYQSAYNTPDPLAYSRVDSKYRDILDNPQPGQFERQLNDLYSMANPDLANTAWGKLRANTWGMGAPSAGSNASTTATGNTNNLMGTLGFAGLSGPSQELKDADNPTKL